MQDYQKWQIEFEEVLNKDFTCLSRPSKSSKIPVAIVCLSGKNGRHCVKTGIIQIL